MTSSALLRLDRTSTGLGTRVRLLRERLPEELRGPAPERRWRTARAGAKAKGSVSEP